MHDAESVQENERHKLLLDFEIQTNHLIWVRQVIDTLSTVTKTLIKGREESEIRGRVAIIQTTALLRSARILRRVLET